MRLASNFPCFKETPIIIKIRFFFALSVRFSSGGSELSSVQQSLKEGDQGIVRIGAAKAPFAVRFERCDFDLAFRFEISEDLAHVLSEKTGFVEDEGLDPFNRGFSGCLKL